MFLALLHFGLFFITCPRVYRYSGLKSILYKFFLSRHFTLEVPSAAYSVSHRIISMFSSPFLNMKFIYSLQFRALAC